MGLEIEPSRNPGEQQADPLDIFLPSASKLIEAARVLLSNSAITHGPLTLMADVSQNVALTDNEHVFIKVYRRRDGLQEPRNTVLARAHGAVTPELLTSTDWCSVWRYEPLAPLPLGLLPEALSSVRRVHDSTRNAGLIESLDYEEALSVVRGRLGKLDSTPLSDLVDSLASATCEDLARLTHGADEVFSHSDLQLRNMGVSRGQALVFDWEICRMAPVELELSKLEENLFTSSNWRPGLTEELYGAPLDPVVLNAATRLRYTQNLAFFMERGEASVVEAQLEAFLNYRSLSV